MYKKYLPLRVYRDSTAPDIDMKIAQNGVEHAEQYLRKRVGTKLAFKVIYDSEFVDIRPDQATEQLTWRPAVRAPINLILTRQAIYDPVQPEVLYQGVAYQTSYIPAFALINVDHPDINRTIPHELGHAVGLPHCSGEACLMHANTHDNQNNFCEQCALSFGDQAYMLWRRS